MQRAVDPGLGSCQVSLYQGQGSLNFSWNVTEKHTMESKLVRREVKQEKACRWTASRGVSGGGPGHSEEGHSRSSILST